MKSYAELEKEVLGDDEYKSEGKNPFLAERELSEEELEGVTAGNSYAGLIQQLTEEQQKFVMESDLLAGPPQNVVATLKLMIEENKQKLGM